MFLLQEINFKEMECQVLTHIIDRGMFSLGSGILAKKMKEEG